MQRFAVAALAAVLCFGAALPAIATAESTLTWHDGRWHDQRGNVWLDDRAVWWHPVRDLYYINNTWRTGDGQYWDEAAGAWRWPVVEASHPSTLVSFTSEAGVERWRPLVESIFGPAAAGRVLQIMDCESEGDPWATGAAGERGLMQIHPVHPDSTYDPEANLRAAYRLSLGGTNWDAWTCS